MSKHGHAVFPGRIEDVPPWCYWRPGMSPEAAALAAVKAMGITHPLDLLNLLWALRRHARAHDSLSAAAMPEIQPTTQRRNA